MTSQNLREIFLEFFKSKGHAIIPSASLIPEATDPTVLFTTAGMHPLVPYLLGEKHPQGKRLANVQKCVRTGDIDAVGDPWHLTFFEMLGNWSLGDPKTPDGVGAGYFKEEAITMAWEFLTSKKWLGIDPNRLAVSVFEGDQDAPYDSEAANIWQKVGMPKDKIYSYPKSENWWGPAGETGPCGPDTEIFFDTLKSPWKKEHKCEPKCECGRYAEIWNLVFMEYKRGIRNQESGIKEYEYVPLKQKNVDTGMGLERTIAILNGKDNVYETDLFEPIIEKLKTTTKNLKLEEIKALRIIVDHLKASVFILNEKIFPSNLGQGYVLRRLIRRAIRYARTLELPQKFLISSINEIIRIYQKNYSDLKENKNFIQEEIIREQEKFEGILKKGQKKIDKVLRALEKYYTKPVVYWPDSDSVQAIQEKVRKAPKIILAKIIFNLVTSDGVPFDFIKEKAEERGLEINEEDFKKLFKKHQELSRKGAEKRFKGGLVDASEATIKYHTVTHLLHQALRQVLGEHVEQRGSNITPERLRFDFSHPEKMTTEQIQKVEEIVNQKINEKLPVTCEEMSPQEAKEQGAIGLFGHKYGERVKVYSINNFSREICGGPHVQNTGELGKFKIIKEESSSAGVRRIKAILK